MGSRTRALARRIPGAGTFASLIQALANAGNVFLRSAPPGHFYSPIPDREYVLAHRAELFDRERTSCPGIALNVDSQIELVRHLASYYEQMPFSEEASEGRRYSFRNSLFGHGSAIVLYSLMRHFQPRRIIEIGSGYSSAAMLDVNDLFFDARISFTFAEPYPDRLLSLLSQEDRARHRICVDIAQNLPRTLFSELGQNDILFIDSSHVAKVGSDVVYLLTEILPILRKGVIVHIHDIYWPFEYPEDWVLSGKAWNEAYLVKAFLQFNSAFEILLFNSYLGTHHRELMRKALPLFLPDSGSGLWLRKSSS